MDVYGRNSVLAWPEPRPQHTWTDIGVKVGTRTEDSMRRLGIPSNETYLGRPYYSAGTRAEDSMRRLGIPSSETYLGRPGVLNCVHYLRTGVCGFGTQCQFNHPPAAKAMSSVEGDYPERPGEHACQHYLKSGNCKFGATCKFDHPRNAGGLLSNLVNFHGYPLRPGEKACFYYARMGQCKFGISCRYHHPDPPGVRREKNGIYYPTTAPSFFPTLLQPRALAIPEPFGAASTSFMPIPPNIPCSYVPGAYGPMLLHSGVGPHPGWTYSAPMRPTFSTGAQSSVGAASLYGANTLLSFPTLDGLHPPMPFPAGQSSVGKTEVKLPERPGQLECQFYMRTGDCNFGPYCKYDHPPERSASVTAVSLNPLGLPLRPHVKPCSFYMRTGFCMFNATCKFDHPVDRPLPGAHVDQAGSPLPTLPTSLSPDFSPHAARMSSFEATSSAFVALTLSEDSDSEASVSSPNNDQP